MVRYERNKICASSRGHRQSLFRPPDTGRTGPTYGHAVADRVRTSSFDADGAMGHEVQVLGVSRLPARSVGAGPRVEAANRVSTCSKASTTSSSSLRTSFPPGVAEAAHTVASCAVTCCWRATSPDVEEAARVHRIPVPEFEVPSELAALSASPKRLPFPPLIGDRSLRRHRSASRSRPVATPTKTQGSRAFHPSRVREPPAPRMDRRAVDNTSRP